ncbi:zinc finger protein 572-like protein [Lates japonicus]|uniref:Zinc finger protein 572-like protein n=1 Tax=Lates japonicus TaxID=270547 RepID=A0AAD3NBL3_LATJO|nr:zinc finger protein 572-like protein [Lates japonicus]
MQRRNSTDAGRQSFIRVRLRRTEKQSLQPAAQLNTWKQKLMERTVEDQDQTGTQVQTDLYNLRLRTGLKSHLDMKQMTVIFGKRAGNVMCPADVQQLLVTKEEDQQDPEPPTLKRNRRNSLKRPVGATMGGRLWDQDQTEVDPDWDPHPKSGMKDSDFPEPE